MTDQRSPLCWSKLLLAMPILTMMMQTPVVHGWTTSFHQRTKTSAISRGARVIRPTPFLVSSPTTLSKASSSTARYGLLEGLFGEGGSDTKGTDADGNLAVYPIVPGSSSGLSEYLFNWAKLLETGGIKGLTTPVKVSSSTDGAVQLVFQKVDTGYKSKSDEKQEEADRSSGSGDKKKKGPVKQGGVEIVVESEGDGSRVLARRCNMDEDTVVKEMSEETILKELQKALDVWKKDHQ